ncbi:hypothetical protein R1flu_022444 [Riccia fluitans]|uniref:Uncharacterized protein n=1 Tax=Riccia fluitans TaxID=41844 RepID=A0ABD1XPA5_9MARC
MRPGIILEFSHDAELIAGETRSSPHHHSSTYPSAFAKETGSENGEIRSSRNNRKILHGKLPVADDTRRLSTMQDDVSPLPVMESEDCPTGSGSQDTLPIQGLLFKQLSKGSRRGRNRQLRSRITN